MENTTENMSESVESEFIEGADETYTIVKDFTEVPVVPESKEIMSVLETQAEYMDRIYEEKFLNSQAEFEKQYKFS